MRFHPEGARPELEQRALDPPPVRWGSSSQTGTKASVRPREVTRSSRMRDDRLWHRADVFTVHDCSPRGPVRTVLWTAAEKSGGKFARSLSYLDWPKSTTVPLVRVSPAPPLSVRLRWLSSERATCPQTAQRFRWSARSHARQANLQTLSALDFELAHGAHSGALSGAVRIQPWGA